MFPASCPIFHHGVPQTKAHSQLSLPSLLLGNASFAAAFPFIVLMPQCPAECLEMNRWIPEVLADVDTVLDKIRSAYHGDPKRTVLTGQSMGGHGIWLYAMSRPHKVLYCPCLALPFRRTISNQRVSTPPAF